VANKDILELVFKHSGGVELRAVDGREDDGSLDTVIWASDSDQDFTDEFPTEIFEPGPDTEKILDYLIEADILDEDEAEQVRIFSESLDGRDVDQVGTDPDDDDDGDEDEEFDELDREVRRVR
jgi:hypothetical protein